MSISYLLCFNLSDLTMEGAVSRRPGKRSTITSRVFNADLQ